jgi:hypothetical protein
MLTVGASIDLGGRHIEVDDFLHQRIGQTLFNHGAHICAIQILALDVNVVNLTSIQLKELVDGCDADGNGVLDAEEWQQCCLKLGKWVIGELYFPNLTLSLFLI